MGVLGGYSYSAEIRHPRHEHSLARLFARPLRLVRDTIGIDLSRSARSDCLLPLAHKSSKPALRADHYAGQPTSCHVSMAAAAWTNDFD
jgi:hypothetical protein